MRHLSLDFKSPPYWRYVTQVCKSIILWLYLLNAVVYTFSPALAENKNLADTTVVDAGRTNVANGTNTHDDLDDRRLPHQFEFKSPDWVDIRLTIIEVTISILGYCCALDIVFSCK